MNELKKIKIYIVDDHPIVLDGVSTFLSSQSDFEISGHSESGVPAIEEIVSKEIDIVLMDVSLPRINGIEVTRILLERNSKIKVIIFTMHDEPEYMEKAIEAGAVGYLLKNVQLPVLFQSIRIVASGGIYFDPSISEKIINQQNNPNKISALSNIPQLTPRELEVMKLIASSFKNKEIGNLLKISVRTVEAHRERIMTKLNLSDAAGITRFALQHKLID